MRKANSKKIFDICHRANGYSRSIASRTTSVDSGGRRDSGVIIDYIVSTPMGEMRRNRQHLTKILDA